MVGADEDSRTTLAAELTGRCDPAKHDPTFHWPEAGAGWRLRLTTQAITNDPDSYSS